MKQNVMYTIKDDNNYLIDVIRSFPDEVSACNFVKEIKSKSITKPIIADKEDIN